MATDSRDVSPGTMHKTTPSSQYMKSGGGGGGAGGGIGGGGGGGRTMQAGRIGRNPYLNFLREFRKRNPGLTSVDVVRRGAQKWQEMPRDCKLQYIEAAFYAPKKRKARQAPHDHDATLSEFMMGPDDGCCPRRRKRRPCPCPRRRPRRKCPRRRPKRRSCKRRRRRCG